MKAIKKIILMPLVALLLFTACSKKTPAEAIVDISEVHFRVSASGSKSTYASYVAEIENIGDLPVTLSEIEILLIDEAENNVPYDPDITVIRPTIAPGESTFIIAKLSARSNEGAILQNAERGTVEYIVTKTKEKPAPNINISLGSGRLSTSQDLYAVTVDFENNSGDRLDGFVAVPVYLQTGGDLYTILVGRVSDLAGGDTAEIELTAEQFDHTKSSEDLELGEPFFYTDDETA